MRKSLGSGTESFQMAPGPGEEWLWEGDISSLQCRLGSQTAYCCADFSVWVGVGLHHMEHTGLLPATQSQACWALLAADLSSMSTVGWRWALFAEHAGRTVRRLLSNQLSHGPL